jgi:hypothetical protein
MPPYFGKGTKSVEDLRVLFSHLLLELPTALSTLTTVAGGGQV